MQKAASAKESPELGITVAIGIFIHNVPEGIAISGEFLRKQTTKWCVTLLQYRTIFLQNKIHIPLLCFLPVTKL